MRAQACAVRIAEPARATALTPQCARGALFHVIPRPCETRRDATASCPPCVCCIEGMRAGPPALQRSTDCVCSTYSMLAAPMCCCNSVLQHPHSMERTHYVMHPRRPHLRTTPQAASLWWFRLNGPRSHLVTIPLGNTYHPRRESTNSVSTNEAVSLRTGVALPGEASGDRGQTVRSSDASYGLQLESEQSLGEQTGRSQRSRCSSVGQRQQRTQLPLQRQFLNRVIVALLVDYTAGVTLRKLCPAACLHANRWWLRGLRRGDTRPAACVSRPPL